MSTMSDDPAGKGGDYALAVEDHLRTVGHYENVLELQATDPEFCKESLNLYLVGYQTGQSEKVVALWVADVAHQYQSNRELALLVLQNLQRNLLKDAESVGTDS